jgi:L-fuculose-phosphate aldolase
MSFSLLHPRDQLVRIMQRIYNGGMTTLSGGNLSIQDDDGSLWITPAGIDKGKLTPKDIIRITPDGVFEGAHRPSSEHPFHRAIYAARPDLRAIVHAHPPALVSFSIARQIPATNIIPQARYVCGEVGYAPYALPGSEALGANIAATFAQDYNVVLLENHGAVAGGADLLTAFQRLETLDFCARTLIRARQLGEFTLLTQEQIALFHEARVTLPTFAPRVPGSRERELRQLLADIVQRAYQRQLMIATQGVVSARLSDDSFLISPTGIDRAEIDAQDMVLIERGACEAGKQPSRSARLHEAIYRQHPDIGCIITSQSPAAAAYAITAAHFDTRTIPESYILLRDIPLVPFGAQYREPERVAEAVSLRRPVVLIQNDCILTVGKTILETFDRLEVAEYSARALIDTAAIGALVPIGGDDIRALETAFALT